MEHKVIEVKGLLGRTTYKYKTHYKTIAVGDMVVVENRGAITFTVMQVVAILDEQDIAGALRWIVQKIDTSTYNNLVKASRAEKIENRKRWENLTNEEKQNLITSLEGEK